jgi:hypothetical protein
MKEREQPEMDLASSATAAKSSGSTVIRGERGASD